jgi:hypothetical protein
MTEIPEEVKRVIGSRTLEEVAITVSYKNWRGETAIRKIVPLNISFNATEYHPKPQWLLQVYDLDKNDFRDYALKDIEQWTRFPS